MNIALWIVQTLLALAFGMAGVIKTTQRKENLAKKMPWTNDFSQRQLRIIGTLELLAAIGLILPHLTGILPILTPLAAIGLVLTMIGAAATHLRRKEPSAVFFNLILLALAAFVAHGRFGF